MGKAGKIESLQLAPRILSLGREGKTSYEMSDILTREGYAISQATIARWLKKQRDIHHDDVQDIVSTHVAKEIPKDLDALEEMEAQCLAWAREDPAERAERISNWKRVRDAMIRTKDDIFGMNAENEDAVVKAFIDRVIGWIVHDIETQKVRIGSMRMATSIIDTKLKYSGILDGQAGGNIIIAPYGDESEQNEPQDRGLYLVKNPQTGGDE
jgi:hypothetical protein